MGFLFYFLEGGGVPSLKMTAKSVQQLLIAYKNRNFFLMGCYFFGGGVRGVPPPQDRRYNP